MLLVQEYLKNHSFGQLAEEHGVYASFNKSGHKFSLNYDQIEAKESDPLAQQCRGLILALVDGSEIKGNLTDSGRIDRNHVIAGNTTIVAFPMVRFFNEGQGSAAAINWHDPNLKVLEKLDGTCCILYFDHFMNKWNVATRSVPEADLLLDGGKFTFRTLFEKALTDTNGQSFDDFTHHLDKSITYVFELCTPYNVIVVQHQVSSITLLAARDLRTLQEIDIETLDLNIPKVKGHTLKTIEDIYTFVSERNPLEFEGVVVLDSEFNRIKVKNASYVAFSRARDVLGSSDRNCLELILAEKEDDVLPALPSEIQQNLMKIKDGYRQWLKAQDELYTKVLAEASAIDQEKKTFAINLMKNNPDMKAYFFSRFDGKSDSMKDFVQKNKKEGTWSNSFLDKILESI